MSEPIISGPRKETVGSDSSALTPSQQKAKTDSFVRIGCFIVAGLTLLIFMGTIIWGDQAKVDSFAKYILPFVGTLFGYAIGRGP